MLPGFLVASDNVPPSHRKCISPSGAEGTNHSPESRLPDGSAPAPGKPALPGLFQGNTPIPVSIPLGVIEHFPMAFTHRLPQLEVENGAGF